MQRVIDPHPVAKISVWFEHRLELDAIDRSVDGHLSARGQVLARRLRQPQYSRCFDRGQRGVEANGCTLCALTHHRLSSSPFRTRPPTATRSSSAPRLTLASRPASPAAPARPRAASPCAARMYGCLRLRLRLFERARPTASRAEPDFVADRVAESQPRPDRLHQSLRRSIHRLPAVGAVGRCLLGVHVVTIAAKGGWCRPFERENRTPGQCQRPKRRDFPQGQRPPSLGTARPLHGNSRPRLALAS
jgi:hypothetical protein